MSYFEAYGEMAQNADLDPTYQSGRVATQVEAERLVARDVANKLQLKPTSTLLEIGCGPGNLLIPLSFAVKEATGIDHPAIIERYRPRYTSPNVNWLAGEFPNVDLDGAKFDRILVYSVIHYVANMEAAQQFIAAAIDLLAPGGVLLVGDVPNSDLKTRFLRSERGKAFDAAWRQSAGDFPDTAKIDEAYKVFQGRSTQASYTDEQIARLILLVRGMGLNCYLLPQSPDQPWGNTREDLLISRP